jgi:hypothetical protein
VASSRNLSSPPLTKEQENPPHALVSSGVAAAKKTAVTKHMSETRTLPPLLLTCFPLYHPQAPKPSFSGTILTPSKRALSEMSPISTMITMGNYPRTGVFPPESSKMTRKEKRQLRNRISANQCKKFQDSEEG